MDGFVNIMANGLHHRKHWFCTVISVYYGSITLFKREGSGDGATSYPKLQKLRDESKVGNLCN